MLRRGRAPRERTLVTRWVEGDASLLVTQAVDTVFTTRT
jgi:hypothetical protein